MKSLLTILIALIGLTSQAQAIEVGGFKLLDVKAVYIDYMYFKYSNDPFLAPSYQAKDRLDLHLDLELMNGILFFDNMVHSKTDEAQYRLIGWNYRAGVHLGNLVDCYIEHFSMHLLDYVPAKTNSYDAIGFRLYFYRR